MMLSSRMIATGRNVGRMVYQRSCSSTGLLGHAISPSKQGIIPIQQHLRCLSSTTSLMHFNGSMTNASIGVGMGSRLMIKSAGNMGHDALTPLVFKRSVFRLWLYKRYKKYIQRGSQNKPSKAARKRFKVTKTGKIKRLCAGSGVKMGQKTRSRARRLRRVEMLNSSQRNRIKKMLSGGRVG